MTDKHEPSRMDMIEEGRLLYHGFDFEKLASLLPSVKDRAGFEQSIVEAGSRLNADLYNEARRPKAESRKRIAKAHSAAVNLIEALRDLDIESERFVDVVGRSIWYAHHKDTGENPPWSSMSYFDASVMDPENLEAHPREDLEEHIALVDFEPELLNGTTQQVEALRNWLSIADKKLEVPRGRPRQEGTHGAIELLLDVWHFHTGEAAGPKRRNPTLSYYDFETTGPFLSFCRDAFAPVLNHHNINTDLERAVRNVLYP